MTMKFISLFLLIGNFLLFIVGALWIFSPPKSGGKARLKSSLSLLGIMIAIGFAVSSVQMIILLNGIIGLVCLTLSTGLFILTARVHKERKLSPINSLDSPVHLVQRGPYKHIRHPFYTSYLLSFLGGAIVANSMWAMAGVLAIFYLYTQAADQEEEKFLQSPLADNYRSYRNRTGKFFPLFFATPQKYSNSGIELPEISS